MKDRESGRNYKVTSVYGYLPVCACLLDRAGRPISMSTGSKTSSLPYSFKEEVTCLNL